MTGFEVIVRPAVFPNIRPSPPRILAPADNPDQGLVVLTGGGAKWVTTSFTWNVSVSRDAPHKETKRQFNVERVYQKDDDGNINKDNFVDVERLRKLKLFTLLGDLKVIYADPPKRDNVETKLKDQSRGGEQPGYDPGVGGGGWRRRRRRGGPMTIIYVTTGPHGAGTGTPNNAAQVDGNFYDVDQRIVALNADLAEGKRIDTVTYTATSMTFHFTDGSTQTIPLPIATITYVGQWTNSTPYTRGSMVSVRARGMYQVLVNHLTPAEPAVFDEDATDGSGNPLYSFWMPLYDVNYDAAIFVPGTVQRAANELLFQAVANRAMRLGVGDAYAYAYLDVGNDAVGATDIVLSIEKNRAEIGTITFVVGDVNLMVVSAVSIDIPAITEFVWATSMQFASRNPTMPRRPGCRSRCRSCVPISDADRTVCPGYSDAHH